MSDAYGAMRHTVTYSLAPTHKATLDVVLTPGYTSEADIPQIIRLRYAPLGAPERDRDALRDLRILAVGAGIPL